MLARISTLFMFLLFALPLLAAASVVPRTTTPPVTQCNTGTAHCCTTVQETSTLTGLDPISVILGLLGIVVSGLTGVVGLGCSSLTVIGNGCNINNEPICCTGNTYNGGLVNIGCSPINIL